MAGGKHFSEKDRKSGIDFFKIWGVIYILVSAAFMGMLIYMNMFTVKLLAVAGAVVLVLAIIAASALFRKSRGKAGKIVALIVTLIFMACYAFGIYYIGNTMHFLGNITGSNEKITEYYVVVNDNSDYEKIDDIDGNTVIIIKSHDTEYDEAKKQLKDIADIKYMEESSINDVCISVLEKNSIIFVPAASHNSAEDILEGYSEGTRILYTVKVKGTQKDISKKTDVTNEPFNVYVSGIDTEGSITSTARSDVNMILTIDPVNHKILMTSIPRDSYVPLQLDGRQGQMDKFTHTGIYGIEETVATAEALLGIDINYYVKVNFTTVRELIDILGGIEIVSEKSFVSRDGIYYAEGVNYLNGNDALSFARERKAFANGDLQRNRNQQIVVEGVIKKVTSSTAILTGYTDILKTIENYMATNMKAKDIQKLAKMQLGNMTGWKLESSAVTGVPGCAACYSHGGAAASVVYTDDASVREASGKINSMMGIQTETDEDRKE